MNARLVSLDSGTPVGCSISFSFKSSGLLDLCSIVQFRLTLINYTFPFAHPNQAGKHCLPSNKLLVIVLFVSYVES